jgi:hypothetical protein
MSKSAYKKLLKYIPKFIIQKNFDYSSFINNIGLEITINNAEEAIICIEKEIKDHRK